MTTMTRAELEGWSIDHERQTVSHSGKKIHGVITQTQSGLIRDFDTGEIYELEILHRCELSNGEVIILDESEPCTTVAG